MIFRKKETPPSFKDTCVNVLQILDNDVPTNNPNEKIKEKGRPSASQLPSTSKQPEESLTIETRERKKSTYL